MRAAATPELLSTKPRLRGVIHQWSALVAVVAGAILVAATPAGPARWATLVYALSLVGLLGVSATYHRVSWRAGPRRWMRRLDHSAIFVLIAGTFTPLSLASREHQTLALALIWGAALLGTIKSMLWPGAPKALTALLYIAMGWSGVLLAPAIAAAAGGIGLLLLVAGGVLYSVGALAYVLKRPNPVPGVFGYHEVFHALVVLAAALHFALIVRAVV